MDTLYEPPRFFISYSLNKALRPESAELFITLLKDVIVQDLKGTYLDLFESNLPKGIKDELTASLRDCDCLVAEATNAAPNVYFEAGFADALGKPVVTFLDRARDNLALKDGERGLGYIRKRVFGGAHPSDLGDLRYTEYDLPDGARYEDPAATRLRDLIRQVLAEVTEAFLPPPVLMPRRSLQTSFHNGLSAIKTYRNQADKLWLIDGMSHYLGEQYAELPSTRMRVDESIYRSMLRALSNSALRTSARALADLASGLEPFLLTSNTRDVEVKERIFVFENDEAFTYHFEELANDVWRHAQSYQCYMVDRAFVLEQMNRLGIFELTGATSANIMATGEAAVWYSPMEGFPGNSGRELLTIDHDRAIIERVEALFRRIRELAVDVSDLAKRHDRLRSSASRGKLIKSHWLRQRELGSWEPEWSGATTRSYRYYSDYETHIRIWVPEYRRMSSLFLDQAMAAVGEAASAGPVSLTEVGPGTGELTQRLLHRLRRRGEQSGRSLIAEYVLYESAHDMLERIAQRGLIGRQRGGYVEKPYGEGSGHPIPVRPQNVHFLRGSAPRAARGQPAVLIGSLVHHYIDILDTDAPDMGVFLEAMDNHLPGVSHLVFSGVFFNGDVPRQIAAWREWMRVSSCLDEGLVDRFFSGNPEMQRPFSVNEILSRVGPLGWSGHFTPTHTTSPFGVLSLRRTPAA